jgi:DNA-binding CsgD family transcriptional regulator
MAGELLVGRQDELAVVHRRLDHVSAGSGGVLLVVGEAGIGKSRLLGEAADRARERGVTVLSGRAVEGGGTYRPIAQALLGEVRGKAWRQDEGLRPYRVALGRLLPGWTPAAGEDAERFDSGPDAGLDSALVLGEGLLHLLRAIGTSGGCLLLLEDLHWADADTLAVVGYLATATRNLPILVIASARDDWPGAVAVDRLARIPDVRSLRLSRLSAHEVVALAEARAGGPLSDAARQSMVTWSEGLPFLVEELATGLDPVRTASGPEGTGPVVAAVPASFASLVSQRLSFLSAGEQRVVAAAAVLGVEWDAPLLTLVAQQSEAEVLAALRAAVDVHLLTADSEGLAWRHALTRDAVLATLLPPERAAVARRAAVVLQARGRDEDEAAAAEVLLAASERVAASDMMLRLAHTDLVRGALRSAEGLLERAAAAGASPTAVAIERVRLLTLGGQSSDALTEGAAVLESATGEAHAELAFRMARAAIDVGRWNDARLYVHRAGRPDDPRSPLLLANVALGAGDLDEAVLHATAATDRATQTGRPDVLCESLLITARFARLHDPVVAASMCRRAAQVAAEAGLTPWRVEALLGLGAAEMLMAETSVSLPYARELALDAGLLTQAVQAEKILTEHHLLVDGPGAAERPARRILELGTRLKLATSVAAGAYFLSLALVWSGKVQELTAIRARLSDADAWAAGPEYLAMPLGIDALSAVLAHDLRRADALLDTGMAKVNEHPFAAPTYVFGFWALMRTVVDERADEARETLRRLPAVLRPANRGALQYADAVAAGRRGRAQEAWATFAEAEATLSGVPWLRRFLRLIALEAAVTDGWGDPVAALRASLAEHERAGEPQLARTCRDLLRRAGAPTRAGRGGATVPPQLRALGVTSREMDVLTLVAEGRTNGQIAGQLFLSPRTVETHVARLLAKTASADRGELRSLLSRDRP